MGPFVSVEADGTIERGRGGEHGEDGETARAGASDVMEGGGTQMPYLFWKAGQGAEDPLKHIRSRSREA